MNLDARPSAISISNKSYIDSPKSNLTLEGSLSGRLSKGKTESSTALGILAGKITGAADSMMFKTANA